MQSADIAHDTNPGESAPDEQPFAAQLIEIAWLVGLFAVPVLFTPNRIFTFYNDPKYFVLHLVAVVIVVSWVFEWATARQPGSSRAVTTLWTSGIPGILGHPRNWVNWVGRRPERWAVIAGALFVIAAVASTLASPAPRVSLWGRDNLGLGNELYSLLALLTVFFAVALRLRTMQQASRALQVLMASGVVTAFYGLSQNFGWDPIGPGEDFARNFSSFGNAIFFGSFLLMASFATIAVALEARRSSNNGMFAVSTLALGVELAGLWTTESRGPLLGVAAGLLAFGVIGAIWLNRKTLLTAVGVITAGIVIALVISLVPDGDAGAVSRNLESLGNIFDAEQTTSIGLRVTTWEGALELAGSWERSPAESTLRHAMRPVFGLGPDMYFYSYPLSIDNDPTQQGLFFAHVHNYPMQVLLELGLLGLMSFLAIALLVVYAAIMVLRSEKRAGREGGLIAIFMAALLAALVGRAVEQMSGVANVSDLVTFWALAGLVIALAGISRLSADVPVSDGPARAKPRPAIGGLSSNAPIVIAFVVLLLGFALFFMRDVRGMGASRVAAQGFNLIKDGDSQAGLGKYERAVELNPEVELYVMQVDFMIRGEADVREDPAEKIELNELSLAVLEKYESRDPFAHATQRRIAKTELALGRLGQTERFESAVQRYTKLAEEMRSFPTMQALAADGIVAAGDGVRKAGDLDRSVEYTELGLFYADRSIALNPTTSRGWWVRGVALERLGLLDNALASYFESVTHSEGTIYLAETHKGLARVYDAMGDAANAEIHRLLAEPDPPEE